MKCVIYVLRDCEIQKGAMWCGGSGGGDFGVLLCVGAEMLFHL